MLYAPHLGDEGAERLLHVFDLQVLVVGELPVKAKNGDAPAVHDPGIDLAIAVLVGDHLAATREPDVGAVIAAIIRLELFPVAAATGVILDAAHEAELRHAELPRWRRLRETAQGG